VETAAAYLWVALGSALGGVGRFWLAGLISGKVGQAFPWGTLVVNVTGSFLIGILVTLIEPGSRMHVKLNPFVLQFFLVGICGGYTTFSALSLQTLKLIQTGQWLQAGLNVILSVVLCLIAVWLGYLAGALVNR
jgi:fluoride exporter